MTHDVKPLDGIRVVEFSHMVMGPSTGLVLADLGAEVIKIEPPGGDKTRRLPGSGQGFFPMYSRNKRSVIADLKTEEGLDFTRRIVSTADVVTENFRAGAMTALGLDYPTLSRDNPRLVYCSLKGFLSGPYEDRAALDEVVQMMGGLAYMTGKPGEPLRAGASVNDVMGGMFAVIAILAALRERDRTSRGSVIRSGLFENNLFLVGQHMAQFALSGQPAAPMPARLSAWAVYDVFTTKDGEQVFVAAVSDGQWKALCLAFGLDELAQDPDLRTNALRVGQRDKFLPILRIAIADYLAAELLGVCQAAGLPYAPVRAPHELYDDPHVSQSPGAMIDVQMPDGATLAVPALPVDFDGDRPGKGGPVEQPGASTRQVAEQLGYPEATVERLVEVAVPHKEASVTQGRNSQ
ncbi:CoA transferase [Mycolicibacterium murale]|uniref:CoA transferase n=1 Tax=Mycolicibacterium murale TaxID=182220 RepID=A0A7I9WFK5_9MYCO|nr:CoA transferase [Mycolicibacterium murale]GFG56067.1 CoA transferase [Mycolicibacterium murale]